MKYSVVKDEDESTKNIYEIIFSISKVFCELLPISQIENLNVRNEILRYIDIRIFCYFGRIGHKTSL